MKKEQQQQPEKSETPVKPILNRFRPKNNTVVKSIRKISLPIESNDKSSKTIAEILEQQNNKPILENESNQIANNNIQKKKKNVVKITLNGLKNFNIDEIEDDDDDEERSFLIRELEMKKLKKLKK